MGLLLGSLGLLFFLGGDYKTACWFWIFAYFFRGRRK